VFGTIRYSRRASEDAFDSGIEVEQVIIGSDASQQRRREPVSRQPLEILLVEDNPADVRLTAAMLKDMTIPHHLTVASDGAQALDLLNSDKPKPDFVLLDLSLPKVNGFGVLQHIRSAQTLCMIRVVILSGSAAPDDIKRARELGAEAYLQKPEQYDQYADLGSRIGTLINQPAGQVALEHQTLLAMLKQRFSDVVSRADGRYEIDRRILLSPGEAQALVEEKVTLEEILIYRNRPSHLMPERVRLALTGATP
jgi:chemotaxis family two-component system response regulator Rcp1